MPFPYSSPTTTLPLPAISRQFRTWAGRPHAFSGRPMLIHMYHAVPMPRLWRGLGRSLSERHVRGMAGERRGNGMACVNQTWSHCVSRMGKTQSKPLVERHGRGMAWERHDMCETNTAALCESNGKDTIWTLSGTAWQGNGMGTAWYVWIRL
jgi:hypothetical protein